MREEPVDYPGRQTTSVHLPPPARHSMGPCLLFIVLVTIVTVLAGTVNVTNMSHSTYSHIDYSHYHRLSTSLNHSVNATLPIQGNCSILCTGSKPISSIINCTNISELQSPFTGIGETSPTKTAAKVKLVSEVISLAKKPRPDAKLPPIQHEPSPVPKSKPKPLQSCEKLKFASDPLFPKTALATFPGSGNTWTRHIIQQLTGNCDNIGNSDNTGNTDNTGKHW